MLVNLQSLPQPTNAAQLRSQQLTTKIAEEITNFGPMPFSRYMQMALYDSDFGYYTSSTEIFGEAGDFITAPELSALFSRCVAKPCAEILRSIERAAILECGAGSGILAYELLLQLQQYAVLPDCYYIYEVSPVLRERQQQQLAKLPAELAERVCWLTTLDGVSMSGCVLANELLDAFPVERFVVRNNELRQLFVDWDAGQLVLREHDASEDLRLTVNLISNNNIEFAEAYSSECCLTYSSWFRDISKLLSNGAILLFDYGYHQAEYYQAQRNTGTLLCHFRHYAHDDALLWPGLQDITAHVDFSALAEAADSCGLAVSGYTRQAEFLLACGIDDLLSQAMQSESAENQYRITQQVKKLLMPTGLGETFKAFVATKQYNQPLSGFGERHDLRHLL